MSADSKAEQAKQIVDFVDRVEREYALLAKREATLITEREESSPPNSETGAAP